MNDSKKKRYELQIFSGFAEICPLAIDLATVKQPDPPRPDIVCRLINGENVAFELVEVVDCATGRRSEMDLMLRGEFATQIEDMTPEVRKRFQCNYCDAHIYVEFDYDHSISKRRTGVAKVLGWLSGTKQNDGEHKPKIAAIEMVRISNSEQGRPSFGVNTAGMHSEPVVDRVRTKLEKKHYVTTSRLELLCYFDRIVASNAKAWEPSLIEYLDENLSKSRFAKVWVYEKHEGRVLFRFPTLKAIT